MEKLNKKFVLVMSFLFLSGCSPLSTITDVLKERNPLAGGGASLRVSVDVYKGGLGSGGRAQQRARLAGLVSTVKSILPKFRQTIYYNQSNAEGAQFRCAIFFEKDGDIIHKGDEQDVASHCSAVAGLGAAYLDLSDYIVSVSSGNNDEELLVFSNRAASLATLYARTALEYSNSGTMRNDSIRRLVVIANSLRHVSDQIDVAVQYGSAGARDIPLSAQLRATSTENFTDLYTWSSLADVKLLSFSPIQTDRDAATALKMLDERNYWENINQAYASGQGEFSIALIKDDIGNWDIKNFSNDPTELRAAQQEFAIKAIEKLATDKINTSISSAQKLADFARGLSTVSENAASDSGLAEELDRSRRADLLMLHEELVNAAADWSDLTVLAKLKDECKLDVAEIIGKQGRIVENETEKKTATKSELENAIFQIENKPATKETTINIADADAKNKKLSLLIDEINAAEKTIVSAKDVIAAAKNSCNEKELAYEQASAARKLGFRNFFDSTAREIARSHKVLDALQSQNKLRE